MITDIDSMRIKAKTDKAKLEILACYLTEWHLDIFGGYPHDCIWIGDTFIVADLDDSKDRNRTQLQIYKRKQMLDWYKAAEKFSREHPDENFKSCLSEVA